VDWGVTYGPSGTVASRRCLLAAISTKSVQIPTRQSGQQREQNEPFSGVIGFKVRLSYRLGCYNRKAAQKYDIDSSHVTRTLDDTGAIRAVEKHPNWSGSENMSKDERRIDMHAHFYGGGLVETITARQARPYLRAQEDGTLMMVAMNGEFPFTAHYHDYRVGLADMKAAGLTHRLLTFPGALGVDLLPANEIATAILAYNDYLSELTRKTDGALIGLAGVPLADMGLACAEVRRIRRDLGLPGIILPSNYFNALDDLAEIRPLLTAANEYGCHIMLHPGLKVGQEPPPRPTDNMQYRLSAVDLQSSAAQVALTVILSDMLDKYPNITFQVVNLGGTLPFIFERIESIARHRNPDAPFPTDRLRRVWYDCASLGPRALEAAVKLFGADRIMLGSDYPIFKDDPYAHAIVPADLTEAEKSQITWKTADDLFTHLQELRQTALR
jgi:aminocarboxymuconate-semialdehyde decarboxylase